MAVTGNFLVKTDKPVFWEKKKGKDYLNERRSRRRTRKRRKRRKSRRRKRTMVNLHGPAGRN